MPVNIYSQWIQYIQSKSRQKKFKKNAGLVFQESHANKINVKSNPTRCFIEITDQCNLRCKMCGQSFINWNRTRISDNVLKKIEKLFPFLSEVWLVGFGESLIDDRFFDILAMIPKHIFTRYSSNGLLIDEKTAEKMVDLRLMDLAISIDAIDEESYITVRGQKGFQQIINNIKTLMRIRDERETEYPQLRLSYTFFRSNTEQFLDFIDLAYSLGISCVSSDYLTVYREDLINESLFFDQELGNRVFRQAREKCAKLGMDLYIPMSFEEAAKVEKPDEFPICYEPWDFVRFRSNGHLSPCCVNDIQLGNLDEYTFEEVWNGGLYQKFREQINTTRDDLNCKQCIGWGIRKITDISYHIKILDFAGRVVTKPEHFIDPTRIQGPTRNTTVFSNNSNLLHLTHTE